MANPEAAEKLIAACKAPEAKAQTVLAAAKKTPEVPKDGGGSVAQLCVAQLALRRDAAGRLQRPGRLPCRAELPGEGGRAVLQRQREDPPEYVLLVLGNVPPRPLLP